MERAVSITIVSAAMMFISAGLHGHEAVAGVPQSQIKPIPRPVLKLRWLFGITLDKTTTIGGSVNGDITGTIVLLRSAINNLTVTLTTEGCLVDGAGNPVATLPPTVTIPAGSDRVTFRIRTFYRPNINSSITCTVRARYGEETETAGFVVEPLRVVSLTILPATGFGPFTATATITLNARPAVTQTVTLTSSNPVVRFGPVDSAQPNVSLAFTNSSSHRTVQVVAGSVAQQTVVTVSATLGALSQTRQMTVRSAP